MQHESQAMKQYLEGQGYTNVRLIDGGWVGLVKLLFTTGLCIDLDQWGYERRFCYEDRQKAIEACNALASIDDAPLPGFIAQRPKPYEYSDNDRQ